MQLEKNDDNSSQQQRLNIRITDAHIQSEKKIQQ